MEEWLKAAIEAGQLSDKQAAAAYELRQQGFTFTQVAGRLGVSVGAARRLCARWEMRTRAIDNLRKSPGDLAALQRVGLLPRYLLRPLLNAGVTTAEQMTALDDRAWSLIHGIGPRGRTEVTTFLATFTHRKSTSVAHSADERIAAPLAAQDTSGLGASIR